MRRRRNNVEKPRERRTLVPELSSAELAAKIESEGSRTTSRPPYDPAAYARAVERSDSENPFGASEAPTEAESFHVLAELPSEPSMSVVESSLMIVSRPPVSRDVGLDDTAQPDVRTEEIGREMYSSYLASDFPEALVLAERVLDREPHHALAQLVVDRCKERLRPPASSSTPLKPSSIVRLKFAELERQSRHIDARTSFVLGHVDGVTDAGTVAALSGLPPPEALHRLHALLDLGVIEVVA